MKAILFICSLSLLILLATPIVDADIARPKPSPSKETRVVLHTSLQIVPDSKTYEARLQIPQSDLPALRAALDGAAGNTTVAASVKQTSTRTIIAGMLLFLSLSVGGVWLARSRGKTGQTGRARKAVAAVLIGMATIGAAAIITRGNAGPPGYYRWRTLPQALTDGRATTGGVDIEIVPDDPNSGSGIKLIIPMRNAAKKGEE
jgi:hypothetical protein